MTRREDWREPTKLELALDFLRARFLSIIAVVTVAGGVALYFGVDPEIPRWARLAGATGGVGIIGGALLGNYLASKMYQPDYVWLIDLDARVLDGAIFRFPYDDFVELTVTDEEGNPSQMYDTTQLTPNLHVGKQVDLENQTVVGTWRGTLDDVDLAKSLQAVIDARGQLQEDAQKGFALEVNASTIVRSASRQVVLDVIRTVEDGTLPGDGKQITSAVDDALKAYDFEDDAVEKAIDELEPADLDPREQRENNQKPTQPEQPQSEPPTQNDD